MSEASVAASQVVRIDTVVAPVEVLPRVLDLSSDAVGGLAVGTSAATLIDNVVESVRPQLVPVTVTWYVPGLTSVAPSAGPLPLVAVHPKRLDVGSDAVQPLGTPETRKRTRSKKVELRNTLKGATTVPPLDETVAAVSGVSLNVPSVPIRDTLSKGS